MPLRAGLLGAQEAQQLRPWAAAWARRGSGCSAGRSRPRTTRPWPRSSRSTISRRVGASAVAVSARRGTCGEALVQHRQLEIVGPEVVAPLRDAVRLVDREQGQAGSGRAGRGSPAPSAAPAPRRAGRAAPSRIARSTRGGGAEVERRVEHGGPHAELGQRRDLVLHQRDQRRDDDREPVQAQGRHLVAQRLAAAGRHQHQRVVAARTWPITSSCRPRKAG